jgi:hypothetical protein
MQIQSRNEVLQLLTELEVNYWHDVDHNWGRMAHTLYVDNGAFIIGDKLMAGCSAIAEFYRWREGRGDRTARHVVTNFRLERLEAEKAYFQCVLCLYAADGKPVLESRPAIMIADVVNECVLCADNLWRFASHRLYPLFMGGEPPTIPPETP